MNQWQTMNQWQKIESAPKDGTLILLYRPTAFDWGKVTIGKYDNDSCAKKQRPFWEMWFKIGGVTESRSWVPTHWMPLPEQPKIEEDVKHDART